MTAKSSFIVLALLGALLGMGACGESSDHEGGDTHWLGRCEKETQCQSGASCWCGICSKGCAGDDTCAESGAACFELASPGISDRCEGSPLPKATGICLGLCKNDANCSAGSECLLGACVPKRTDLDAGSGGSGNTGGQSGTGGRLVTRTDGGLPRPTDFADVEIPADFTDPVAVPPPDPVITGNATPFMGTWIARNEFVPCSGLFPCSHLELEQGPNGGVVGTVWTDPKGDPGRPEGPFSPPTDPDVGYPAGVDPGEYFGLRENNLGGVHYTVFEGQVRGNVLSFWTSGTEIWKDWCALQTPYLRKLGGQNRYRCVPVFATKENTDPGKYSLCTTAWDGPICPSRSGNSFPCSCLDENDKESVSPDCVFYSPVCDCTADECHADLRSNEKYGRLELRGDTLVGEFLPSVFATNRAVTLVRETP